MLHRPFIKPGVKSQHATLLASASIIAVSTLLLPSNGAVAQTATPPTPKAASTAPTAVGIPDIIVTAQRRSENVQKTPLAVSAYNAASLRDAGVTSVANLQSVVPGLQVSTAGSITNLQLRGVGSVQINAYGDPDISYSVDDVYQGKSTALNGSFYDINRVEVLKGPQGTLYGRNATGGAVNVITNDPSPGTHGAIEGEIGNYGLYRLQGMLNVPIDDELFGRVAFQTIRHDGYLSDGYDDADNTAARAKLLWKPNDRLRVLLSADYYHEGGKGSADVILPLVNKSNPWQLSTSPYTGDDGFDNNTNWGVSAKIDYDLGFGTLTVIPAYRSSILDQRFYSAGQLADFKIDDRQETFETRLTSNDAPGSKLKWVAGLFLLNDDAPSYELNQHTNTQPYYNFQIIHLPKLNAKSYAAFGQTTYSVTSRLRLTAGVRYTDDDKSENGDTPTYSTTNRLVPAVETTDPLLVESKKWSRVNWKVGIDGDLAENSLVYANLSTGYKAGGFDTLGNHAGSYAPEDILAYSVGSKNRFFSSRLQLNLEYFYQIYRNHQISTFISAPAPVNVVYATINAAAADIQGLDADATLLLTANDRLGLAMEYLEADFTRFELAATSSSAALDNNGRPLPYAPKWSGTVSYQHIFDLADGAELIGGLQSRLVSDQWLDFHYLAAQRQGGYTRTGLTLRYEPPEKIWYGEAYVENLENRAIFDTANSSGKPTLYGALEAPRTFGVRIGAHF